LRCAAHDLGGTYPRRIIYFPMTGKVVRRLLTGRDEDTALREESEYASSLQLRKPSGNNVELFK
jgi:chemotaxis protein CheD